MVGVRGSNNTVKTTDNAIKAIIPIIKLSIPNPIMNILIFRIALYIKFSFVWIVICLVGFNPCYAF